MNVFQPPASIVNIQARLLVFDDTSGFAQATDNHILNWFDHFTNETRGQQLH